MVYSNIPDLPQDLTLGLARLTILDRVSPHPNKRHRAKRDARVVGGWDVVAPAHIDGVTGSSDLT